MKTLPLNIVLTLIISLCGVAAVYGASKSNVSHLQEKPDSMVVKQETLDAKTRQLELDGVRTEERYRSIFEKLDSIDKKLKRLEDKIDAR